MRECESVRERDCPPAGLCVCVCLRVLKNNVCAGGRACGQVGVRVCEWVCVCASGRAGVRVGMRVCVLATNGIGVIVLTPVLALLYDNLV